jgi:hypothetical protein
MYKDGQGVPQDYAEAAKWYHLAAEQGDADAQNNLGTMYDTGEGVPQDYAEAAKWYRLAAEQGDADAQLNLGTIYALGHGIPQNFIRAHMWFNIAAIKGKADGVKGRNAAAKQMTSVDISKAQTKAREWTFLHGHSLV